MTADTNTTEFSKFIRTATPEAKEKVFNAVMDKSIEAQLESIAVQEKSDEDYPPIQEVDDDGFITIYATATKAKQPVKEYCEVCGALIGEAK